MKILSINQNTSPQFKSDKKSYYISKKMFSKAELEASATAKKMFKKTKKDVVEDVASLAQNSALVSAAMLGVTGLLKPSDISYCEAKDGYLNLAFGYNNGFYRVKSELTGNEEELKSIIAYNINKKPILFGGLINYEKLVEDVKRQDIVQKGLMQHGYELNDEVSTEMAVVAASRLSKLLKRRINPEYLFFIDSDSYYYDRLDKTVYSIDAFSRNLSNIGATLRICTFETDSNGSAVGYKLIYPNIFTQARHEAKYKEQQSVSEKLPRVADTDNNKLYAEAFRFGNMESPNSRQKNAVPKIMGHLIYRVGIKNPDETKLQFVRYYDKDKNIIYRINYYDSTTGRSLVYNDDGKYMYQMQYEKDDFGNIRTCSKF